MHDIAIAIFRAKRSAAVIVVVREARSTLKLPQIADVRIDMLLDIEKLAGSLIMLVYTG